MKLEQDQEVWIRVKVVSATPHRVKVGIGEIYAVVCEEHYNRSSPQIVFVGENDIIIPDSVLRIPEEELDEHKIDVVLEELFHEIDNLKQLTKSHDKEINDNNNRVEELEGFKHCHLANGEPEYDLPAGRFRYTPEPDIDRLAEVAERAWRVSSGLKGWHDVSRAILKEIGYEEPLERECSSLCMYRDSWPNCWSECPQFPSKVPTSGSVTYKPPEIHNVCRVCDAPIGRTKAYCPACEPFMARTGAELISSMDDQIDGN